MPESAAANAKQLPRINQRGGILSDKRTRKKGILVREFAKYTLRAAHVEHTAHNASNCICLCAVVTRVAPRFDCSIQEANCVTRHLLLLPPPPPAGSSGQFSNVFSRIA